MSMIHTFEPSPDLRDFVVEYLVRTDHLGAQVLVRPVTACPDVVLVVNLEQLVEAFEYRTGRTRVLPPVFVVGPQTGRRAEIFARGNRESLIVRFAPGAFHRLFHVTVEPLADTAVDASAVIGDDVRTFSHRLSMARGHTQRVELVEAFLRRRVPQARPMHVVSKAAAKIIDTHGSVRVASLVAESHLSARQFERAFREQMGTSPKVFARVARLFYALGLKRVNPTHTWTRVSQEAGYFDQNHFVKEFKALAGETPSTFPLTERLLSGTEKRRPA